MAHATHSVSRLSLMRILPLTLTGFMAVMTETMPVGMLKQLAQGLAINDSVAGQLVAVYAAGSFLAIIPVMTLTRGINRKIVLLSALAGFCVSNLAVAVTSVFWLVAVERFVAGVAAGSAWGLIAGYTVRVSPPDKAGRALAIMGAGQPVALAIAVPLVSSAVQVMPWHWVFALAAVMSAGIWLWCLLALPGVPGEPRGQRMPLVKIVTRGNIPAILLTLMCWITAHHALYTYISPYLDAVGHSDQLRLALFIFGGASFVGIMVTSVFVDRALNTITAVSLAGFVLAGLLFLWGGGNGALLMLGVVLWGFSFGGAPTLLVKYLADSAGKQIDMAQAAFATVFNTSIFTGALVGGVVLYVANALGAPLLQILLALTATLTWFFGVRKKSRLGA